MGLLNVSKLEKLKILSYNNRKRTGKPQQFEVMFNPESYSFSYENVYDKKQALNSTGKPAGYSISRPRQLSIKIILDATGVNNYGLSVGSETTIDVYRQVQTFLELTTLMDGTLHEPKSLTVSWGSLVFKCRLNSLNVNYTLFNSSGMPLRAELDARFFEDIEQAERLKKENKSSPDLTHTRIIKAGDHLPLLCEQIYGSPHYYIYVARANKLHDFRNIQPGQELFFPPIEK